jgi:uncharacterized protein (TIGR00251 family)
MTASDWIQETQEGVLLRIQAQPKASRSEVAGLHGEPPRLKIRLAAPPVDGEANDELIRFLKKKLGIPASQITLIRGQSSKMKDVLCQGISSVDARSRLEAK